MTIITAIIAITGSAAIALPMAAEAMPPADAWEIGPIVRGKNYSVGMPAHPDAGRRGAVMLDFPMAGSGQVDALTTDVGPLSGARQITVRYRIDAAPSARFIAEDTPGQPATVSLYFQQAGDNWSGRGRFASYRWYSPGRAVIPLTPGEHSITVQFSEQWTNVNGQSNRASAHGFAAAMEDTAKIGIAFGSASRRSHGVYATGPARFTLISMDIE